MVLKNVLKKNLGFKKYITDMKLHVIDDNGNSRSVHFNARITNNFYDIITIMATFRRYYDHIIRDEEDLYRHVD